MEKEEEGEDEEVPGGDSEQTEGEGSDGGGRGGGRGGGKVEGAEEEEKDADGRHDGERRRKKGFRVFGWNVATCQTGSIELCFLSVHLYLTNI